MKIELDYVKVGDYYLPDLTIEPPPDRSLGKYGLLRLRYLKGQAVRPSAGSGGCRP